MPARDAYINDPSLQYNLLHELLGNFDDVAQHQGLYFPYSDCAIAGHYFQCLDVSSKLILEDLAHQGRELGVLIFESELYRAKNSLYNALLRGSMSQKQSFIDIGKQLMYYKRRLPRSEIATRISSMTPRHLKKVYSKYLVDPDLAYAGYGPTDFIMHIYDET